MFGVRAGSKGHFQPPFYPVTTGRKKRVIASWIKVESCHLRFDTRCLVLRELGVGCPCSCVRTGRGGERQLWGELWADPRAALAPHSPCKGQSWPSGLPELQLPGGSSVWTFHPLPRCLLRLAFPSVPWVGCALCNSLLSASISSG